MCLPYAHEFSLPLANRLGSRNRSHSRELMQARNDIDNCWHDLAVVTVRFYLGGILNCGRYFANEILDEKTSKVCGIIAVKITRSTATHVQSLVKFRRRDRAKGP